jgi:diguanylate cyclase (GGDEF)-like protein
MAAIKRKSTVIILIVVCLIVFLSIGGLNTIYLTHTIKTDAEIINKLGIIRGAVQRLVKLEAVGIRDNEIINDIDARVDEFRNKKIRVYDKENEIEVSLNNLYPAWLELKESIYIFRDNPSVENQKSLLAVSEEIWNLSNVVVASSQASSERKTGNYKFSYIFFFINFILGLIIIYLLKKYVQDKLEFLVNYDALTNIFNRRYFNKYLDLELAKAERYNRDFSIIIFDIDKFKRVNDNYGHDVGDSVLKELAQLVEKNIRKSDTLFRIGGEEFTIIASEAKVDEALILSEKIRKIIEKHDFKYVKEIRVSLGITQFYPGDNTDLIIKRADTALYKAKDNGRNRSEVETIESEQLSEKSKTD